MATKKKAGKKAGKGASKAKKGGGKKKAGKKKAGKKKPQKFGGPKRSHIGPPVPFD
jgi:hypothetical protein